MKVAILSPEAQSEFISSLIECITLLASNGYTHHQELWLDVPQHHLTQMMEEAGLDIDLIRYKAATPKFAVKLFPQLREVIEANCIYPASGDDYYMSMLPGNSLYLGYQKICGSRNLMELSEDNTLAIMTKLKGLVMSAALPGKSYAAYSKGAGIASEWKTLRACGDMVLLPPKTLVNYAAIKSALEQAGGVYQKGGFRFSEHTDTTELLTVLQGGEKVNVQKRTQFFATPQATAQEVCNAVAIVAGERVLEPSGGRGAIADIARQMGAHVVVVESWVDNIHWLRDKDYDVIDEDFLQVTPAELGLFDVVVANPPWTRNADIDHVLHMLKFIKPGGRLSVLTSTSWQAGSQRKQVEFKSLMASLGATIKEVPRGTFKESGTTVGGLHITLTTPKEVAVVEQAQRFETMDLFA